MNSEKVNPRGESNIAEKAASNLAAKVRPEIVAYVEAEIFPQYAQNDSGHQLDHIAYVVRRSLDFAATAPSVDFDIVYVVAAYHDLGHHLDAAHHEQISSQLFRADARMKDFFAPPEIALAAEAIEDHRASSDHPPRSVYGKIVASADKNIDVDVMLRRTYAYRLRNSPAMKLEEMIEESRQHLIEKYGKSGYARAKTYFPDPEFDQAMAALQNLIYDPLAFEKRYRIVNNLPPK